MPTTCLIIFLHLLLATTSISVHARPLSPPPLAVRLRLLQEGGVQDGGSSGCWDSVFELQSCTGEIILFFLNGETYLGHECCRAIVKIEKQCWSSLPGSLGFTKEEGDILRGYCDASTAATPPPPAGNTATTAGSTIDDQGRG